MKNRTIHYMRATVAAGSFAALMLVGVPLTDEYFGHRSAESAVRRMRGELTSLKRAGKAADNERQRGAQQLAELTGRATTGQTASLARDAFVEMARESGCHVRSINATEPDVRPWAGKGDDPLAAATARGAARSGLVLHTTRISLTVVGTLDAVQALSRQISNRRFLAVTDYVGIQPITATGDSVQMELRIRLFGLVGGDREGSSNPSLETLSMRP